MAGDDRTAEATELLQALIRNACVNDGSADSGHESKSVDLLAHYLDGAGLDVERYEPTPGRASLVARIEGSDRSAPTLMLMGHTDVVPVTPENWLHDPFGGELIDGEVWGRGAVDMLNLTATMAVATKQFGAEGFRPRGTLIYLAVADEEAAGTHGAEWLVEHQWDEMACDYVLTESGGMPVRTPDGIKRPIIVGEKGLFWFTLHVKGTPGHGSQPLRTDNALVKAAEIVNRLAAFRPPAHIHEIWRRFVEGMNFPLELSGPLLDPDRLYEFAEGLPMLGLARQAHACTHTTFAPTMATGGLKHNVIPDRVSIAVDGRTLPGQDRDDAMAMLDEILGPGSGGADLRDDVEVEVVVEDPASASPIDTPLWDALQRATEAVVPGSVNVPFMTVGGTDSRFFRRRGIPSYGYGLFSDRIGFDEFADMFHGDNERVDVESLRLTTELWDVVVRDLVG
ncbi:MAG: M20/M25/M40 family metallo-hydrolase [Actinobacteria bacterium]|nr:M20/M25/M40 family metallo-hydrolase [Actinomycetota bacterium]